jgi:SAM-dependent methyltransferase
MRMPAGFDVDDGGDKRMRSRTYRHGKDSRAREGERREALGHGGKSWLLYGRASFQALREAAGDMSLDSIFPEWSGVCPVCLNPTTFRASNMRFRDTLICTRCGSIPRERALMSVLREIAPAWRRLSIHESSPVERGASVVLRQRCKKYIATQFFPDVATGTMHHGFRCENLEAQTFADESFDVVVTLDVMEHVPHPERAYKEIWRTLVEGGYYIHTTPIYKDLMVTMPWAENGEYHGNPISKDGSLVTFHYGYDLGDLIVRWAPFDVSIRRFNDRTSGIVGDFTEVIVCRKRSA